VIPRSKRSRDNRIGGGARCSRRHAPRSSKIVEAESRASDSAIAPITPRLGRNLFFATAPTNQLYPSILKAHGLDCYVAIFDAFFTLYFRGIVASVLNVLYDASADPDPARQWLPNWDPCFRFERSAPAIQQDHPDQYGSIAVLLHRALQTQIPGQVVVTSWEQSYKELALSLTVLNDYYAYMFAHELGHLHHGHLKDDRFPSAIGLQDEGAAQKESDADYHAFALLTGSGRKEVQLRTYVNVSILFHIKAIDLLIRSLHRSPKTHAHITLLGATLASDLRTTSSATETYRAIVYQLPNDPVLLGKIGNEIAKHADELRIAESFFRASVARFETDAGLRVRPKRS
jgi:hypothetical protein